MKLNDDAKSSDIRIESTTGDRLLKVIEVQELLGYSRATVYRLIGEGKLPVVRVAGTIRFRYHSMLRWIADHETPAAELAARALQANQEAPTDSKRTQAG